METFVSTDLNYNALILTSFSIFWFIVIFCFLGPCLSCIHNYQHPQGNPDTPERRRSSSDRIECSAVRACKFSLVICHHSKGVLFQYEPISITLILLYSNQASVQTTVLHTAERMLPASQSHTYPPAHPKFMRIGNHRKEQQR